MGTKKYWKGLEELNNSPEFVKKVNDEKRHENRNQGFGDQQAGI